MTSSPQRKVVVVGAGAVGSTFVYALAQTGLANTIALIDTNTELLQGQVLDLAHGKPFFPAVTIQAGTVRDYGDANLIVITAGTTQRPGESRLNLLQRNAAIMRSIVGDIVAQNSNAVMLIVSNPVDIMTHVAIASAGTTKGRVFGSGTVLDSARFRYFLSERCGVDIHNIHAYILGEHGDSEFAAWSMTNIAGVPIADFRQLDGTPSDWPAEQQIIEQQVRDSAYHIIDYKGATWFAVGMALVKIATAVLRGEKRIMTVSTQLHGEFGLDGVCLSVPAMVSANGVERVVDCQLTETEQAALEKSATILKTAIAQLEQATTP
jgi:L-lactate dehydrogenase